MLLLLVRHAVTSATGKTLTGWLPGFSLSEVGERQAIHVADRLAALPIKAIYSSPLDRCLETARVIATKHGLTVNVDEAIGEIKYGDWQGRSLKSLYKTKAWYELRARPADFRFPGGETVREAQIRGMNAIEAMRRKHRNQAVVVCSHADLIRVVTAGYLGLPLDLYHRMSIGPASVTAIAMHERGPQLIKLSDSGSLDDLKERLAALRTKDPKPSVKERAK